MAQYETLREDWQDHSVEAQRSTCEGDWVVVEWLWRSTGAASGAPVEMIISASYRIENGKIDEVQFFWTWAEAVEAVRGVE